MGSLRSLETKALRLLTALTALSLAATVGCSQPSSSEIAVSGSSNGIIGGTDAQGDEDFSKTIVSLVNVIEGSLCTASILSDSILVTAAHCVDAPAGGLRVVFGTDIESDSRIVQKVEGYEVSPLWAFRSEEMLNAGDIAVVRFSGGLPAGYKPAKVLSATAQIKNGDVVMLAGYGINDGVAKEGSGKLRYVETTIENAAFSDTEILVEQRKGKGACHGDSGGPAYAKVNGEWVLWGVTNRGVNDPNDHCSGSAAYANIPFYRNWIAQTAKKLLAKKPVKSALASNQ